MFFVAENLL